MEKKIKNLERAIKPLRTILAALDLSKEEEETILKANYILNRAGQCEPMIEVGGDGTVQVKGTDEERKILEDTVKIVMKRQGTPFREV